MTHAMFQALDINGDGFISTQDLLEFISKSTAATEQKSVGRRNLKVSCVR
jgi:Ca2+-binding EF-hand superfamily protein